MKIAVAQIACALADLDANIRKIGDFVSRAKDDGAELIVFPEMSDTGYSMPIIQAHAMPWTKGAVPELKKIAKMFSSSPPHGRCREWNICARWQWRARLKIKAT